MNLDYDDILSREIEAYETARRSLYEQRYLVGLAEQHMFKVFITRITRLLNQEVIDADDSEYYSVGNE